MKNNKGITLIALIITIIVMLILVAVTVSVVVNSNLIGTASGAKTNTELAYGEEANMSGFNVSEEYYNNIDEYINTITGNGEEGGNGTIAEDGTVIIDPEGTHILHVFGQKYQIGDATTWSQLINCVVPITVEPFVYSPEYGCSINGHAFWPISNGFECDFEARSPEGLFEEDFGRTIISMVTEVWLDEEGDWITDKTVNTLAEVVAFEGFETHAIYLEEQLPN